MYVLPSEDLGSLTDFCSRSGNRLCYTAFVENQVAFLAPGVTYMIASAFSVPSKMNEAVHFQIVGGGLARSRHS